MSARKIGLSGLLAIGVLSWSVRSFALGPEELGQGSNDYVEWAYFDFTSTAGAGHDGTHTSGQFPAGTGNVVQYGVAKYATTAGTSQCWEINTQAPRFYGSATGDTRFWTMDSTGTWRGLNDDSGGTLWSRARIWLDVNATAVLVVAAYSSTWDTMHFDLYSHRLNLSEADCTTNQSLPWYKVFNGGSTAYSANAF